MVSRFVNLPIGRKIAIVTGTILAMFLVATLVATLQTTSAANQLKEADALGVYEEKANQYVREMELQRALQAEYLGNPQQSVLDEFEGSAERAFGIADELVKRFPENAVLLTAVQKAKALDEIHDPLVFDQYAPAVRAGRTQEAVQHLAKARDLILQFVTEAGKARQAVIREVTTRHDEAASALSAARTLQIVLATIALLLGIGLSYLLFRMITNPLKELKDRMWELAEGDGDLTKRIEVRSADEVGQVAKNFNRFAATVHDIVRLSSQASDGLARNADTLVMTAAEAGEAVAQTAGTVDGMAAATTMQAERVTEVGGLVEDMGVTIGRAADAGRSVAQVAAEADERAAEGERSIARVQEAMSTIERSVEGAHEVVAALGDRGREIGAIVQTIGEISAQTNLLALNAAIEAARAGEHGRGFAVVAEEVRKLAEQSQDAVGSIAEIIGDLQQETERAVNAMDQGREEVNAGAEIVQHAGSAFAAIRDRVSAVSGEVDGVASACEELEQAALTVQDRMSEVAAEIAASVQETSAAAESVATTAKEVQAAVGYLDELVGRFKVWEPDQPDRRRRIRTPEHQGELP